MTAKFVVAVAAGATALAIAMFPAVRPAAAQATKVKSQWDGVYTDAQAARGEKLYAGNCAPCHNWDLKGNEIGPALTGPSFAGRWNGKPLGDLFEYTQAMMPQISPGGLTRQQNADILAFIFKTAAAPAGKTELSPRPDALAPLTFIAR
jgi:mono/diheme cytochrome c family protein